MKTEEMIILANGQFPQHTVPLELLHSGRQIVCCDGAIQKLIAHDLKPTVIVGDMDSIEEEFKTRYADKLVHDPDQETNDLTKAINYCLKRGIKKVFILGATGLREDHTLGNISLLADYARWLNVEMYTDTGIFIPILKTTRLSSFEGQQVSVFSLSPGEKITYRNLQFPLDDRPLNTWWQGTLNQSLGDWFELVVKSGVFLVYTLYKDPE